MDRNMYMFLCLALLTCISSLPTNDKSNSRKVLLILIDGFRWDYLNQTGLIGFPRIAHEGIQAEYMEALYPSESFPGYYSVATGLYAENHGMVLNHMYDKERNAFSQMTPNGIVNEPFWWEDAEPIWITTTKKNIDTAMYLWPGSSTLIQGITAKYTEPHSSQNGVEHFRYNLNRVLDQFQQNQIEYAQVYCEYTDMVGHAKGPNSFEIKTAIHELDQVINQFLDNITMRGMNESIHFVIVSDHGMAAADDQSVTRIIIDDVIPIDSIERVVDRGSHMGIYPKEGADVDQIINSLKGEAGLDVYRKEEIPERYHFKNHRRVPPIYVVVHHGYFLQGLPGSVQHPYEDAKKLWGGFHGYDPIEPDMRAIFLAWGKSLKSGYKSPPIHITDPYNLLTHLIGIEPLPNNGTWSKMEKMLFTQEEATAKTESLNGNGSCMLLASLFMSLFSLILLFSI